MMDNMECLCYVEYTGDLENEIFQSQGFDGKFYLRSHYNYVYFTDVEIKFCPFCGRSLEKPTFDYYSSD